MLNHYCIELLTGASTEHSTAYRISKCSESKWGLNDTEKDQNFISEN